MLDSGHSGEAIAKQVGVSPSAVSTLCSRKHSTLPKAIGGCSSKLSPANIRHSHHLITSDKAENAVQVTKALANIIDQPLFANTVCLHLKKSGIEAVVKTKCPILSARHCKVHLEFTYTHKDWTIDDWKRVVWSEGQMDASGLGKRQVRGSVIIWDQGELTKWCLLLGTVGTVLSLGAYIGLVVLILDSLP